MAKKTKRKVKIVTEACHRKHVDELPWTSGFHMIYSDNGGDIFVSWASVFQMLHELGLKEQAVSFTNRIANIRLKK
jgi:hypothetical protein